VCLLTDCHTEADSYTLAQCRLHFQARGLLEALPRLGMCTSLAGLLNSSSLIPSTNVYTTPLFSMGHITFFQHLFLVRTAVNSEGPGSQARPHGPRPYAYGSMGLGPMHSMESIDSNSFCWPLKGIHSGLLPSQKYGNLLWSPWHISQAILHAAHCIFT
jgi:hypothetical protein